MSYIRFFIALVICSAMVYVLNTPIGQIPPLGKFLDPFKGAWHNALLPDIPDIPQLKLHGLTREVQVVYNKRGVPHIFAQNDHDLCFAAGYVMARHRLWQMEFIALASLGRTSEIFGERTLERDRFTRKTGMTYAVEKMMVAVEEDTLMNELINAYTEGVNAWIKSLTPGNYPFEYKLLGYAPEPWTLDKCAAIHMSMNQSLTFGNNGLRMSALKAKWGKEAVIAFYDTPPKYDEPILSRQDWDFPLLPPDPPSFDFIPQYIRDSLFKEREPGIGSNNWAVSGALTRSGYPMLATDPHLTASLPSIWFEIQLNAPGVNVYGVTVPGGGPFVVMGFNEKIAWGNTNTGNEVMNIYEIEINKAGTHYFYDNRWIPLTFRHETYKVKGGKTFVDSIAFTHHGPLLYRSGETPLNSGIPVAHAISWTPLETGNPAKSFYRMNRAEGIAGFRSALASLNAPPQNYGMATASGDIAEQQNGLWPLMWDHQGMFISDGRRPEYDWKSFIPFEYLPYEVNPPRGFISSANQRIAHNYPYYHGWSFGNSARPNIINRTLSENRKFTLDDMKKLQLNCDNFWAGIYLDQMLDSLKSWYAKNTLPADSSAVSRALIYLQDWNRVNEAESIAATIFNRWITEISLLLWKPLTEPGRKFNPVRPGTDITFMVLFHEPPADTYRQLFGKLPATAELLAQSFKITLEFLEKNQGKEMENWQWWKTNGLTLNHLLNVKALNHPRLKVGGSSNSPNAIVGSHAPSWRMVVSWGEPLEAWGIYPGGQSGNPATRGYDAFVNDYAEGKYYPLKLYPKLEDAILENSNVLKINPK
jgi:penicillin G amidase